MMEWVCPCCTAVHATLGGCAQAQPPVPALWRRHHCDPTRAWSSAHLQSLRLGGLGSLGGGSSAESTPFGTSRAASGPIAAGAMLRTGSGVSKVLDC